jgi:hypothetical protein
MKLTKKKFRPIYKLHGWIDEGMHVGGEHGHDKEPNFFQKLGAFNYGMDGVHGDGA